MSKELEKEYLADLDHYDEGMGIHSTSYKKCKERLIRLAQIDNANPSKALEYLEWMGKHRIEFSEFLFPIKDTSEYKTIKQALVKAQEQEKVLNELLMLINDLEPTFNREGVSNEITILGTIFKDYFIDNASDLLKRWLENE